MTSSVREFYDALAADYHLIFPDWDTSMTAQSRALDAVVRPGRRPSGDRGGHA